MKKRHPLALLILTAPLASGNNFFESKIRPMLVKHCYECHSAEAGKSKGGLQLDTREGIRIGGDTGPAVARYGTAGGVRERNASTLIDAPESWKLPVVDRRIDPAEWQRKKTQLDELIKQRDAALASRRPGGRSSEGGGGEMTGFEVVRIITQAKRIEMELSAFHLDGSVKPKIIGVLDKPTTAPPADPRARRQGGPNASKRADSGFLTIGDSPFFVRGSIDNETEIMSISWIQNMWRRTTLSIPTTSYSGA